MNLWSRVNSVLRNVFRKQQVERQLDEEVRACVDMMADERIAAGMSVSEARRTALAEFGGIEQVKQTVREHRAGTGLELLWQDARYGARQLLRNPGFTVTVILTLALSIGANTAIFSIVNALMLTSLPYQHPERMGTIYTRITGPVASDERHHVNGEQWELLRDDVPALISAVSGIRTSGVNLQAGSHVQYVHDGRISAHYFDVLNLQPVMGRNFSEVEDRPHGPRAAILSYSLWRNLFGANRNILGQSIRLKGEPYAVIGVLPEDATIPQNADIYTALQPTRDGEGGGTNFECITRLRDGATWQQADAEINRAWSKRTNRYELADNPGAQVNYYSVPLQKGETATLRPKVLTLMLSAGFILLIACANLAGLTLIRMLRRTPEIATRLALGASQWQIQKQLWIENLLLAIVGGATGVDSRFCRSARVAPPSARALSACGRRAPRYARAGFYPSHLPSDQRPFWHAPCAHNAKDRSAFRNRQPHRDRRRSFALAAGADCWRGCPDRRVVGCFRPAHPHSRPPGDAAAGVQSQRGNDREGIAGRCALSRLGSFPKAAR